MKAALSCCGTLGLLVALLPAATEHGISAGIVPAKVRPGDLFELRVEMSRVDYAQFELQVPTHERLHRVAVESVPVRFEGGRYRQSEIWFLQADSSGEIVIDGAKVSLESESGPVTAELPPLRVEVAPYGEQDGSAEPVGLPAVSPADAEWWRGVPVMPVFLAVFVLIGILTFVALLVIGAVILWIAKRKRAVAGKGKGEAVSLDAVLADLDSGTIASPALERLMLEQGCAWSRELREAVGAALYAGRGEARQLAAMLRKEVAR